ncbi:ankyrin repeat domain-containing protein [Jiangella rhizosphaerae]|uniref:ankyrin repeat domain-containing protein n=1 Tax=Jiangella rhizosphaerae TaxID=2293569 RepID=UPI0018F6EAED|nr:ankyrin repeat domain-containing protein [Jiangella rhizosphaerae]
MPELPSRPDLGHLKKQAKQLLRRLRDDEPGARLSDAQFRLARGYGFASWPALRRHVEQLRGLTVTGWLALVYAGDTIGGTHIATPASAAAAIGQVDGLDLADAHVACAVGDVAVVRDAIVADPGWVHRPGGPLGLPPLVAVTHSSLVRLTDFADGVRECARVLLEAGADPNQKVTPHGGHPLTALYGAAGVTHDRELTALLLEAGAAPDDGESLYHSLGDLECTRLLLAAGATVTGTNAMFAVADHDDADVLRLLLEHGGDPNEPSPTWGSPLLFAIRRRCSTAFVRLLLDAGADPRAVTPDGVGAYRLALRFGLPEVAELLHDADAGAVEPLDVRELVVAACASGEGAAARRLLANHPGVVATLDDAQRRLLPDLAAAGAADAVRLMVEAGWPVDTLGGDWQATALNHAVFRGDAGLTRFLLEHGADPAVPHGFGDTVAGTFAWASVNGEVGPRDFDGCARALLDHGVELR